MFNRFLLCICLLIFSVDSEACFWFFKQKPKKEEIILNSIEEEERRIVFSLLSRGHDIKVEKNIIPVINTSERMQFFSMEIKPKNSHLKRSYGLSLSRDLLNPTSTWRARLFFTNPKENTNNPIVRKFKDFLDLFDSFEGRGLIEGGKSLTRIETYSFSSQEYVDEVVHRAYGFFISDIAVQDVLLTKNISIEGPLENGVYASISVEHESINVIAKFIDTVVGETTFYNMFE